MATSTRDSKFKKDFVVSPAGREEWIEARTCKLDKKHQQDFFFWL